MARRFWTTVHGKMLRGRNRLQVLRIFPLQPLDEGQSHARGQVRIFPVGLLPSSPSRIAKDIDVRRPHRQSLVPDARPVPSLVLVVFRAELGADGVGIVEQQGIVEASSHADRLRKDRRHAGTRHPVQSLVPPVVFRDPQPLDGVGGVSELRNLLFERHPLLEIPRPLLKRQLHVLVSPRRVLLRGAEGERAGQQRQQKAGDPLAVHRPHRNGDRDEAA